MLRGIYGAAAAMDAATQQQEMLAHNLAHVNTPGFRQRGVAFAVPDSAPGRPIPNSAANTPGKNADNYVDFRPGALQHTGAPLDLAIEGDAFFALQGPTGTVYTRNGALHLDAQRQVVSSAGYPVLGVGGGPIIIPADSPAGRITVASDGTVTAGAGPLGKIQITSFQNQAKLETTGPTLFRAGDGANPKTTNASILQGYRESSNVQPAEAMVAMIANARHFEAAQRALRAIADSLQMNTRPQS